MGLPMGFFSATKDKPYCLRPLDEINTQDTRAWAPTVPQSTRLLVGKLPFFTHLWNGGTLLPFPQGPRPGLLVLRRELAGVRQS